MALESSSPYGVGESALSAGKPLFPDTETVEKFTYPFNSSGNFTSVFNSTPLSNAVLNTSVGHSAPFETKKIEMKPSSLSSKFHENISVESVMDLVPCLDDKLDNSLEAGKSDLTGSNVSSDAGPERLSDGKGDQDDLSDNEDLVECGNCDNEFQSLQEYMDHTCAGNKSIESIQREEKGGNSINRTVKDCIPAVTRVAKDDLSDVESFDGKIVYNPDGSAYIFEGDSDSDIESMIDLPQKEGVIIDRKGKTDEPSQQPFPLIDNAFFVPRNPNSFMNNSFMLPQQQTPIMHSYRVYDLRSGKHKSQNSGESVQDCNNSKTSSSALSSNLTPESSTSEALTSLPSPASRSQPSKVTSVPTKPILMCFICKLSFGFSKSFISHASSDHSMVLTSKEHEIMAQKNSSAIIQGIGKDKEPLMSFLEPIKSTGSDNSADTGNNASADYGSNKSNSLKETTSVSYVYTKPKLSDSYKDSTFGLSVSPKHSKDLSIKEMKDRFGKLDNDTASTSTTLFNSVPHRSNSYESSEMHGINEIKKIKLDLSDSDSQSSFPVNPLHRQRYIPEEFKSQSPKTYLPTPYSSSQMQGFYGMCDEHPNGRAQGVECPSCDMVLSSSQSLGGHMTMMHSRNSCKTLKCPKCNWHYKYQETLEIHMKEKHPEGDQKCMYCLTNQPHPRLARGESYSCGYKPYRCEVCNYSTTTKGNLSIHIQSDKHLNNVQDLAHGNGDLALQKHQVVTAAQQMSHAPKPTPPAPSPAPAAPKTPPHQILLQQHQNSHPHTASLQQQQHVLPHQHADHSSNQQQDHMKKNSKPKPTWRCDVCNYETNVARNLRIHMTSEKHTHNMMVLQQNMKHMQRDMQLHQMNQLVMLQQDPSFMGLTGPIPGGITFPYDGSLMMGGMPPGFGEAPMDLSKENGVGMGPDGMHELPDVNRLFQCCVCNVFGTDSLESLHQHLQLDRTKMHEHENITVSSGTYICNLCQYKTNLKANFQLHCKTDKHIQRLQLVNHIKEGGSNNEWRLKYLNVSNPVQVRCNACDYYTNSIHKLQIHTGNPRHEASSQLFCHLQSQDSKMSPTTTKYYQCTLCKFNARSKLGLMQHVHSMQHLHSESMKQLEMKEVGQLEIDIGDIFTVREMDEKDGVKFNDDEDGLATDENSVEEHEDKDPVTTPLSPSQTYNNNNNTIKHNPEDLSNKVDAKSGDQLHECPYCTFRSVNEMHIKAHIVSQHTNNSSLIACPLCQEPFSEKSKIEKHLTDVHNVNSEGLHKLLALVEETNAKMPPMTVKEATLPSRSAALAEICEINLESLEEEATKQAAVDAIDLSMQNDVDKDNKFRCQTCSKSFINIDELYSHQNELGHLQLKQTPRGPGYLCWKKGCNQYFKTAQALQMHFREIHAKSVALSSSDKLEYKYPCQMCTLAFKSQQKLHIHAQLHIIKAAVTCTVCSKAFTSMSSLRHHVANIHDLGESDLKQVRAEMYGNALALASFITDPNLSNIFKMSDNTKQPKMDTYSKKIKPSENGEADSDMSSKENSPSSTPTPLENGIEKMDDRSDNDHLSKEDQAIEEYLNSQAFAEDYDNPSRKFKCHKCQLSYTKQHYLSAHNKTLLHRKGDRLSYPMEKYLDPNRPYKCDICKESFTQHNILLVHYNSVSHLHKVKQIESGVTTPASSPSPQSHTATSLSSSMPSTSIAEKHLSMKSREQSPAEDEGHRPYKCNICKVSYSQGSTLDIHIRSVAHQTRASKLKELAMSGEVDLTRPLIEEPIDKSVQAQQQKAMNDLLAKQAISQQSLLFPGLPGLTSYPGFSGLPSIPGLPMLPGLPPLLPLSLPNPVFSSSTASSTSSQPLSSSADKSFTSSFADSLSSGKALEKISQYLVETSQSHKASTDSSTVVTNSASLAQSQNLLSGNVQVCTKCSAVFASQDSYSQHQMFCSGSCQSPLSAVQANRLRMIGRVKPAVQRNLLENFGFECVMQFNEFNQRISKREDEGKEKSNQNDKSSTTPNENKEEKSTDDVNPENEDDIQSENKDEKEDEQKEEKEVKVKVEPEEESKIDIPEMNRCVCTHCNKQFSSVWVLKAHKEEVHKDMVPIEMVEEFGDQFKTDFEQSIPVEVVPDVPPSPVSPVPVPVPVPVVQEEKVVKQEMPPPPPPPPAQMPMVDMLQMMNMFSMGMMHMQMPLLMTQPSLMPMMMPPPGMDNAMKSPGLPVMENAHAQSNMMAAQQKQYQNSAMANQKRARTRINDDQLKVLRGYFDINNSPSEEQIQAMSDTTGLPQKVIKHWFRNTLFKERQRNKDSPYNFNNPPSTTLDLEEYEKTGKLTIIEEPSPPVSENPSPAPKVPESDNKRATAEKTEAPQPVTSVEKRADTEKHAVVKSVRDNKVTSDNVIVHAHKSAIKEPQISHNSTLPIAISSPMSYPRSGLTPTVSSLSAISPSFTPASMTSSSIAHVSTPKLTSPGTNESIMQSFAHGLAALNTSNVLSYPPKSTTPNTSPLYDNHNYSPPGGSSGRRANRTRFTDYQIKCLQEYFEQNAYPKDDELEHLSKMLELSPRVIVVWFQNARQKARKIYENQPADGNGKETSPSTSTSPFNRTPGLNYQCKKCQSVFQRYYDLIRHQKRHCFSEHEKQESHMMSDDSDSMSNVTSLDNTYFSDSESETSSVIGKSRETNSSISEGSSSKYRCEKCNMSFHHAELFKEHQALHSMNPGLFLNLNNSSAFGVLQSMATTSHASSLEAQSPNKRKYEMDELDDSEPRDKRLRTTILPEQLDYLYQKYQIDCNPSRKQLEAISKDVGLKKRVVQVWFQNTRARERKGQYRAHQQLIHKRCPICRALFRAKSALESHLATKHPDEMAKGDINIDAIPDAAIESPGPSSSSYMPTSPEYNNLLAPPGMSGLLPYMPPGSLGGMGFPPMPDPIQMSMKQFYEDSFKKYISELSTSNQESHTHTHTHKGQPMLPMGMTSTPHKSESKVSPMEEDAPLDLSKPVKPSPVHDSIREGVPSKSNRSHGERHNSGPSSTQDVLRSAVDQGYMMRRFNESMTDNEKTDEDSSNKSSCPASPGPSMSSQASLANKRYRTQMTSLQVRIMKQIFIDYKTPTMAECEMLGRIIGLQKRVVQVWFQNARAKEKKAKLNMAKTYGQSEMDFPKPPEECNLCNFKYSHKYTIQDHIFTKKHIDKVKEFIQTRADAERELSTSSGPMSGVSGLLRSQQSNDIDHMRKLMEEANAQTQMAQLQSMGLGPLALPHGAMAGLGLDYMGPMKKEEPSFSTNGKSDSGKQNEGSSKKNRKSLSADDAQLQGLNMLSPFGMFPGVDPAMLPYMYPGIPGMMSGMPGVPSMQPGLMPGAEHLLGYDPMTFGTPLSLLQIPQQAIKDVSSKLADPKASVGQYTQDCKSISSLRSLISSVDYNCVCEATVDVGYICKKCQMVYPAKDACMSHQRMMCFPEGKIVDGLNAILKLEQIQYECKLCSDKMSTVQDFKSHCESDSHRRKLPSSHHQQKNMTSSTEQKHHPVSTPSHTASPAMEK